MNVFAAPGEVFEEVAAAKPAAANWLAPIVLLMVVGWIGGWLVMNQDFAQQQFRDVQAQAIQRQVDSGKLKAEQAERIVEMQDRFAGVQRSVMVLVGPPLAAFASPFWWAFLIWLVGAKILKGGFTFMKAVEVAGLSSMLLVLEGVVKTLLILVLGNIFAGPNLMTLLGWEFDPTNPSHSLLVAVDAMAFWVLVVRAIGLARLSGASLAKSAGWVFGLWLLFTGLGLGVGLLTQKIFAG